MPYHMRNDSAQLLILAWSVTLRTSGDVIPGTRCWLRFVPCLVLPDKHLMLDNRLSSTSSNCSISSGGAQWTGRCTPVALVDLMCCCDVYGVALSVHKCVMIVDACQLWEAGRFG
jgi:hypothetical protein